MHRAVDDLGREVVLARAPGRIVSLVPSDTYTLCAIGLAGAIVGRTRWCVEPAEAVARIPVVGGTKGANVAAVLDLRPDLVVANREENARPEIERIARAGVPVLVSFPRRVAEGVAHIARLARLGGVDGDAGVRDLVRRAYEALREADAWRARAEPVAVFVPIWTAPLMTVHAETFVSDAVAIAGGRNVFASRTRRYPMAADLGSAPALPPDRVAGRDVRYPRVTWDEVARAGADLVVLPDEPYAFSETDEAEFRRLRAPSGAPVRVARADGKDLAWYGARAVEGIALVRAIVGARARDA